MSTAATAGTDAAPTVYLYTRTHTHTNAHKHTHTHHNIRALSELENAAALQFPPPPETPPRLIAEATKVRMQHQSAFKVHSCVCVFYESLFVFEGTPTP